MVRLLFVAMVFFGVPSIAASADFAVPANKSTMVYQFAVWNPSTCAYPGKPSYKVRKQPQHGKLDFINGVVKAKKMPAHCRGKVKGLQLVYTPDRGYRGPDRFVLTISQPRFLHDSGARGRTIRSKFIVK